MKCSFGSYLGVQIKHFVIVFSDSTSWHVLQ